VPTDAAGDAASAAAETEAPKPDAAESSTPEAAAKEDPSKPEDGAADVTTESKEAKP
jgi:hypothetical protein